MIGYLVAEVELNMPFAVVSEVKTGAALMRAQLAVKEEFSYDRISLTKTGAGKHYGTILAEFTCYTEDGDEEHRDILLTKVTIY